MAAPFVNRRFHGLEKFRRAVRVCAARRVVGMGPVKDRFRADANRRRRRKGKKHSVAERDIGIDGSRTAPLGKLLGIGLTSQVGIQVVLNILVITDWLPNTGISLPFFSYGGSSLIMLLAQMGIVLSISRTANIERT